MRVLTDLCDRERFSVTNCWQELHFEFSRQNQNWNVQSHYVWWWLITQPRPIWKKAPPGLQRPSCTESRSGLSSGTLMVRTHTLDLTPVAPRSQLFVTIQLLIKDFVLDMVNLSINTIQILRARTMQSLLYNLFFWSWFFSKCKLYATFLTPVYFLRQSLWPFLQKITIFPILCPNSSSEILPIVFIFVPINMPKC